MIEITREEAILAGKTKYFTGIPCKRRHLAERSVAFKRCLVCHRESENKYKRTKAHREYKKKYAKTITARGQIKHDTAKRRAAKLLRTPLWAELQEIKEIYTNCPEGYHVDHIIPLQGKLVSGLHVPINLQYLTAEENLKKGNKT